MIQPTYGWYGNDNNHIKKDYGISSALLSGANLSLNAMNTVQMSRGTGSKAVPIIGMFSGAGQLLLGAAKFPSEDGFATNESEKILSMVNMGLGTTTLILSVWNFFSEKKPVTRRTTWNVYGFPTKDNQNGIAVSYTYRF